MFSITPSRPSPTKHNFPNPVLHMFECLFDFVMCSSICLLRMHAIALAGVSLSYITGFFYSTIPNMCTGLCFQFDLCLLKSVVCICVSLQVVYAFPPVFGCCIPWSVVVLVFLNVYSTWVYAFFLVSFVCACDCSHGRFVFLQHQCCLQCNSKCVYNVVFPVWSLFGKECCLQMRIFTNIVCVSACFHSLLCVADCRVYFCVVGVSMLSI